MNGALLAASRISALVLAVAVSIHLIVIIYAVQQGLTAGALLARTEGSVPFLVLYGCFVLAAAVHAPIGLRAVLGEWFGCAGRRTDTVLIGFAILILVLGMRAALAVFLA